MTTPSPEGHGVLRHARPLGPRGRVEAPSEPNRSQADACLRAPPVKEPAGDHALSPGFRGSPQPRKARDLDW